jgi:hypothetical protein
MTTLTVEEAYRNTLNGFNNNLLLSTQDMLSIFTEIPNVVFGCLNMLQHMPLLLSECSSTLLQSTQITAASYPKHYKAKPTLKDKVFDPDHKSQAAIDLEKQKQQQVLSEIKQQLPPREHHQSTCSKTAQFLSVITFLGMTCFAANHYLNNPLKGIFLNPSYRIIA